MADLRYRSSHRPCPASQTRQAWPQWAVQEVQFCLLYTSDAADERSSVDLGGRRIIKKKKTDKKKNKKKKKKNQEHNKNFIEKRTNYVLCSTHSGLPRDAQIYNYNKFIERV